jgi:hypothetical protein
MSIQKAVVPNYFSYNWIIFPLYNHIILTLKNNLKSTTSGPLRAPASGTRTTVWELMQLRIGHRLKPIIWVLNYIYSL